MQPLGTGGAGRGAASNSWLPVSSVGPVLVIGAAGLVGGQIADALGGRAVTTYFQRGPADGEKLDIRDADAVNTVIARVRPAAVILAAADPFVERCERDPAGTRAVNVEGTANVRRATSRNDALLVVFSSEYVFDGSAGSYAEGDQIRPVNEYGRQKAEVEEIARTGAHLVCRTSGVFGRDERRRNFVLQLVDALREGREFVVPSDQVITPTYAPSLAAAVVELLDGGHEGTFHACGPRVLSRVEFAHLAARAFDLAAELIVPRPTTELGLVAPRPLGAGLSDAKLRAALGHALTDPDAALRILAAEAL